MNKFIVANGGNVCPILTETCAHEGVKRIANVLAEDISLVTDVKPERVDSLCDVKSSSVIICATLGHSELIDSLANENKLDLCAISGKREVYMIKHISSPFADYPNITNALIIVGSDKRGTIYGMFGLSERLGVSPLIYFGDAMPEYKEEPFVELNKKAFALGYTD